MMWIDDALYCDGCGVEISWAPIVIESRHYCCQDCAEGRACDCGERLDLEEDRRTGSPPADAGFSTG